MKKTRGTKALAMIATAAWALGPSAMAGHNDIEHPDLTVNGETEITVEAPAPDHLKDVLDKVYSGWVFRSAETQAFQADDFDNPGMVFVDKAWEVWNTEDGSEGKSCADCHGAVEDSMKGVRAVYPKWNEEAGAVRTLAQEINNCRVNRMGAEAWKYTGGQMAGMEALISVQSRGMPVNVAIDGPARETWEKGKELYYTRIGQLDLACASCHEANYDHMIRADHLSQGQINGFPAYRLKNAKLNTVHGRFKGCIKNVRGVPYKPGGPEFTALELYVASRGNGLSVEGASVRN